MHGLILGVLGALACTTSEPVRLGEPEDTAEECATVEDVAAVQAQIDAHAAEIEALAVLVGDHEIIVEDADCEGMTGFPGSAYVISMDLAIPLSAHVCYVVDEEDPERGTLCATAALSIGIQSSGRTVMRIHENADCVPGEAWGRFAYIRAPSDMRE